MVNTFKKPGCVLKHLNFELIIESNEGLLDAFHTIDVGQQQDCYIHVSLLLIIDLVSSLRSKTQYLR